ncbi:MAG: ribosomal protein S18 acetylase RimI-like enzyme [Cyclobacteriaceae bacterium]|jgi:ribosomal protein S18 acetylase RimI-like enzyme
MGYSTIKFEENKLPELFKAFVSAFAENTVNFKPTIEEFRRRVFEKLNVEKSISELLIHDSDGVVGFMLHSTGIYNGVRTAYNGGMGIIPSHRGNKISQPMYENLFTEFRKQEINKVALEVITTNKPAICLYESLGFRYKRQLKCFRLIDKIEPAQSKIEIKSSEVLKPDYHSFWSYQTTFLDSNNQLAHNLKNETILEGYLNGHLAGYIIFQPTIGRISQLAIHPESRGHGVGKLLILKAREKSLQKNLTVMNIPEEEESSIKALQKIGFKNEVDQYEMELII